jgi:hypothetical protein
MQQEDFSDQAGPGRYAFRPLAELLILALTGRDITSSEEESASTAYKNSYPEMSARGEDFRGFPRSTLVGRLRRSPRGAMLRRKRSACPQAGLNSSQIFSGP